LFFDPLSLLTRIPAEELLITLVLICHVFTRHGILYFVA
jgi:hypothetical protein